MSFTNFIDDGNLLIVQGVNGIHFFEESWINQKSGIRCEATQKTNKSKEKNKE